MSEPMEPVDYSGLNTQLLDSRWPGLCDSIARAAPPADVGMLCGAPEQTLVISGVQLTGACDRRREALLQASLVPRGSAEAWVYGVALGDIQRVLLDRPELRALHVVVIDPSIATLSFACFDHTDWLRDERLSVEMWSPKAQLNRPFAAPPGSLRFSDPGCAVLRDMIMISLAAPFQQEQFDNLSLELDRRLDENLALIEQDGDVRSLFGTNHGGSAIVIAGGPSIMGQYGWLSENRKGKVVIAVSTSLVPLQRAGIEPDIVIAIDCMPVLMKHITEAEQEPLRNIPFVYYPTVHPSVISAWPGPRLTAYSYRKRYVALNHKVTKGFLFDSGTVTHAAVDLAVKMGAREVILLGADFSYPGGKSHANTAVYFEDMGGPEKFRQWVINGRGEKVQTDVNLLGYFRDLEIYIERHPEVRFLKRGRDGAHLSGADWMEDD